MGSRTKSSCVSFDGKELEDGATRARGRLNNFGGLGRTDGDRLGFSSDPHDEFFHRLLDGLYTNRNGTVRGRSTLLVGRPAAPLRAPDGWSAPSRWPSLVLDLATAARAAPGLTVSHWFRLSKFRTDENTLSFRDLNALGVMVALGGVEEESVLNDMMPSVTDEHSRAA